MHRHGRHQARAHQPASNGKTRPQIGCGARLPRRLQRQSIASRQGVGFFWGKLAPIGMLLSHMGLQSIEPNDPITIIFTSGSTGTPKGVVLSYENVASNVHAIRDAIGLNDQDVILGILPFFHSFGYTVTLWTAMALPPMGVSTTAPWMPNRLAN